MSNGCNRLYNSICFSFIIHAECNACSRTAKKQQNNNNYNSNYNAAAAGFVFVVDVAAFRDYGYGRGPIIRIDISVSRVCDFRIIAGTLVPVVDLPLVSIVLVDVIRYLSRLLYGYGGGFFVAAAYHILSDTKSLITFFGT